MSGKDKRSNKKRKDVSSKMERYKIISKGNTQDAKKGLIDVYIVSPFVVVNILGNVLCYLNISEQYCAA